MSDAPATQKVVEHGEASRLPDTSWTWRRLVIIWVVLMGSGLTWWAVRDMTDIQTLKLTIRYGFYTMWGGLTLYGVGATVTDLAKLAAAVKTTRKETVTTAPPPATISAEGEVKTGEPAAATDPAPWDRK